MGGGQVECTSVVVDGQMRRLAARTRADFLHGVGPKAFFLNYLMKQSDDTSEKVARAATTVTASGKLSRGCIHAPRRVAAPSEQGAV